MQLIHTFFSVLVGTSFGKANGFPTPKHSTLALSSARRDLAGVSAGGAAVFGGGCLAGSGITYVCNSPTDIVDVFKPGSKLGDSVSIVYERDETSTLALSEKRGWPTACSINGVAAFLGGGVAGQDPHSKTLDLLDIEKDTITTNSTSIDHGRWGQACSTAGGDIYFAGGKIIDEKTRKPSMTDEVLRLKSGADGKPMLDGIEVVAKLSLAREAIGAVTLPDQGIMFAGGSGPWPPVSTPVVDAFSVPIEQSSKHYTWDIENIPDPGKKNEYWLGVAQLNESKAYIIDNHTLYVVDDETTFSGQQTPKELPITMQAGYDSTAIPAARMAQNGALVEDIGVCFYSAEPSSVFCFTPTDGSYVWLNCSVGHIAGAIVAVGKTLFIAGGADMDGTVTDVIDVFTW